MDRIAAVLFWGFFGGGALLAGGIYLSGRAPQTPQSCTTGASALTAAEAYHRSLGSDPDAGRTGQLVRPGERSIGVTLMFGGDGAVYSVMPDCTVKFG